MNALDVVELKSHPCQVEFEKFFLAGNLEGLSITERMGFMSWDDACDWAAKCTMSTACNFVILKMVDLETGEVERF